MSTAGDGRQSRWPLSEAAPGASASDNEDTHIRSAMTPAWDHHPRDNADMEAHTHPARPQRTRSRRSSTMRERSNSASYAVPDAWLNLDEVAVTSPVENVDEAAVYRHHSLEQTRTQERERRASLTTAEVAGGILEGEVEAPPQVSKLLTQVYTLSYLVFFAILGTLARVGLAALTSYAGTPVIFESIWPNFAGSVVMGFLIEDRTLFRGETAKEPRDMELGRRKRTDGENGSSSDREGNGDSSDQSNHLAVKKTMPLYIGASTGFCGSLTSFSAFIRDVFLALSNDMHTPGVPNSPISRSGGESFMAVLAVLIITVTLCLSALFLGAHIAIALAPFIPSTRYPITRRFIDPLATFLGWGCWLGAVFLAIFPPRDVWRGRVVFSIVFAPLGCLLRFYASLYLNGIAASFPVGTFAVNVFGTGVLGMAWDVAHVPVGGVVGCQVLQGVEDGFCGALTTVSTWVAELSSLRRRHAYVYGAASVAAAVVLLIGIMGGLRWSDGFSPLVCST